MQSFWMPFHSAKCLFLLSLLVTTQGKSCIPSNIHFRPLGSPTRKLCNTTRWDKSCYSVKHKRQQRSTTNQVPSSSCVENSELPKHLVVKKLVPIPEIENIDQFVLFSDLHLRKDNLETCIQVLKQVHQVAYERNAGVLFLGDFWDRRGSLPVEPLNAAIEELQRWQQPLIMIPGNHDQVSYDGTVHSLLPIMVSLKHPAALVIDQPSIFLDALWIPFIREDDLFTKVISSVSPLWSQIDAVFCHTDIQGAQWIRNESHSSFNCTKGVLPDCFPSHVAVYSGHFHKPQQIPNTHIRYVGSPYQVSAMESGQQKYLLRLSRSHRWSVQETIPISLGPKHYYYHFGDILNISSLDFLQPGDRVFLQVNSDIPESQIAPILEQVRQQKASVFTFLDEPDKENSVSSIESENSPAELRDPIRILQQYGDVYKLSLSVMDVGKEIIQQVLASQEHASFDGQQSNSIDLVLDWVHIDGFGSFRDSVTYPLSNRGLVILTGENEDDITSTSNASGKTTLWMAALWCLTTCTTFCSHVIHDDRKEAQVTVYGRWNGHSLQVTRCIQRKRASHRLRIWLDGEEWTCQEIRATQQQLDRWIDTRLLSHCVFFGQHTFLYDLFASNDREWKEQLSRFIPLNIWEGCKHYVRNRLKTLDESILRLRSQIETTENWCKQLESRIEMQQMEYQRLLTRVHLRENDVLYSSHLDRMEHHTSHSVTSVPQRDHYDVLQQLNDRLQDIQEEIHDTKQRLYDLQHGITTIQQQIANHRNQYNYLECIEQQHDEWQQQYKRWKQQRDDRKKQIQSILKQKPTQQQFHEQLQRLQLQWDECQYEMKQKSRQCTQWEEEWTLGKPTGDRNGTKGAYLRWKQWELRYQRYQVEYSKVWNEKMVLQTQWEKVGGKEEDEWICDYCLQPVSPTHHKKALENLQRTYQLSVRREERMSKILNHIQHHMDQAKQEYQQLVYNSMAKAKQEINDIQIEKERIGEERNDVQQQIMQLKQLFKEWQQLDEEQSWKNHLIILLGQLLTEKKKKEEEEERVSSKSGISKESTYDVFNCEHLSNLIMKTLQRRKAVYQLELDNQWKEYEHLQKEYEEQSQRLEEWNNKASQCHKEKSECEARIKYLQKEKDLLEKEAILNSHNPLVSFIQKEREDWEQQNRYLATWNEELRRIEKDQQVLQQLDKVFGPRGIPHFVLKQVLYELQQRINSYLSMISHGHIQVELRPFTCLKSKKEQMVEMIDKKILVKNSHGSFSNRSYSQLSGGQRRRLGVALALAFHDIGERRCGFHCNIMVLDEVFQHLDSEGKKRVANVLEKLDKESIFVVVHDMDEAMNHLPRAFHDIVRKQGDVSSVTVDKSW